MLADPVLGIGGGSFDSPQTPGIGLVVAEEGLRGAITREHHPAQAGMFGHEAAVRTCDRRPVVLRATSAPPGPGVAKPQGGQHVDAGLLGTRIPDPQPDVDLVWGRLGIVGGPVEVAIPVEHPGVYQSVFGAFLPPPPFLSIKSPDPQSAPRLP